MGKDQISSMEEQELSSIDRDREVQRGATKGPMKSPLANKKERDTISAQLPLGWYDWKRMATEQKWSQIERVQTIE